MKSIKIVVNNEISAEVKKIVTYSEDSKYAEDTFANLNIEFYNVNSTDFTHHRKANKIVNDYAVTKLPFVLLCDGDKEYAAVYSEDKDVTIERIIEKLNAQNKY